MAKIVVITENDDVWALSAWEKAIPVLRGQGHEIAGLWVVDARLGARTGNAILRWYVKRLGLVVVGKLACFAVLHKMLRCLRGKPCSLKELARREGVYYAHSHSPNDAACVEWVKRQKADVLHIMLGHIIKEPLLEAAKVGVVNKHAGMVPANRGLWPYVWAVLGEIPQGMSLHKVSMEVDAGELLWQAPVAGHGSMVAFYVRAHGLFAQAAATATERLLRGERLEPAFPVQAAKSLPEAQDMQRFYEMGGRVMRWRDIPLAWELMK